MDRYYAQKLDNLRYDYIVIANNYENPVNYLMYKGDVPFIHDGVVLFDLTLVNGISSNRYATATVVNHKIIPRSISVCSHIEDEIENIAYRYFSDNLHIVENSSLPSAMNYLILNHR
ncbi:MAG: type II toxin-antitoxin system RnlB family antitoxin [Oscillospiraceae bacterium]|nr:type II toxin-antitoxin system RnlB family antitoxin [Oscillospiraceae bacterium]